MSKKYVPSWLKSSAVAPQPETDADGWQTVPSKPRYTESMINTSLPARQAPALAPATMASLTVPTGQPTPVVKAYPTHSIPLVKTTETPSIPLAPLKGGKPIVTGDDFPTLGGAKKTVTETTAKPAMKWADMSKDWAKKQKEEEEKAKEEKEKERIRIQTQMKEQNEEKDVKKRFGIITLPSMLKKSDDEPLPSYHEDRLSDEDYVSDPPEDDLNDDQDDDMECDDDWHSRKHRDELY